jgi:hypothetical protein
MFLFSCKKETIDPIAPPIDAKGKIKTIVEYGYSAEEKWGEITEGVITSKESYTYNESGFETEFLLYLANGNLEGKWVNTYDSSNRILESTGHESSGGLYGRTVYKYDNKGRLIKWELYGRTNNLYAEVDCLCDANGRVIQEIGYEKDNYESEYNAKRFYKYTYKYDSKGNKIEENDYIEENIISLTTKFEYNSSDKLIKESEYDDGITLTHEISYSYDSKGNVTDIVDASTDSGSRITKYIYDEFDKVDNWIKRRNYKDSKIAGITKRVITYY